MKGETEKQSVENYPVMVIPGYQLDYIWKELQPRIGGLTFDPDL